MGVKMATIVQQEGNDESGDDTLVCASAVTNPPKKLKINPTGRFKSSWQLPPHIAKSAKGDSFAYCSLCRSDFSVSHGGLNDVKRHVQGAVHKKRLKDVEKTTTISEFWGESSASHLAHSSKVTSAELAMVQFIAMHNLPFLAADHLTDLFPRMFPDSKIAGDFSCRRTKTRSIICHALDPYLKEPVVKLARGVPINILCDESNDRGDAEKLLTVLVRLFNPVSGTIVTRHLDTIGITDLTGLGIFTAVKSILDKYEINFKNVLSFTSDTCNVMKGARKGVIAHFRALQPKIIDVHCICHVVNLCAKAAMKVLPLKVDDFLVDIFYHFHHSVKRITSLHEYADFCAIEYKTILKHTPTRWLSLERAVSRTLDMWEPLCAYFNNHPDVEKSGKVKTIAENLNHPLTKPWLSFLSSIFSVFNKFNVLFQTSSTATVHRLVGESQRLLKTVLSYFVQPSVLRVPIDRIMATDQNMTDPSNHLQCEDIYIGEATADDLQAAPHDDVATFYKGVIAFYETFVNKLSKLFGSRLSIMRLLQFLDVPQEPLLTRYIALSP